MADIQPMRYVILSASDQDARRISTENIYNHVCLNRDLAIRGSIQAPACHADSRCQIYVSRVLYLLGIPSTDSLASLRPQFLSPTSVKIAQFLCNLRSLESALIQVFILKNLNSLRMNTYEKHRGGGTPGPGARFAALIGTHKFMLCVDAAKTSHPEGIRRGYLKYLNRKCLRHLM
jgi:hypothetical protein